MLCMYYNTIITSMYVCMYVQEEFLHTAKMMDCPLSNEELEALLNHLVRQTIAFPNQLIYIHTYILNDATNSS